MQTFLFSASCDSSYLFTDGRVFLSMCECFGHEEGWIAILHGWILKRKRAQCDVAWKKLHGNVAALWLIGFSFGGYFMNITTVLLFCKFKWSWLHVLYPLALLSELLMPLHSRWAIFLQGRLLAVMFQTEAAPLTDRQYSVYCIYLIVSTWNLGRQDYSCIPTAIIICPATGGVELTIFGVKDTGFLSCPIG